MDKTYLIVKNWEVPVFTGVVEADSIISAEVFANDLLSNLNTTIEEGDYIVRVVSECDPTNVLLEPYVLDNNEWRVMDQDERQLFKLYHSELISDEWGRLFYSLDDPYYYNLYSKYENMLFSDVLVDIALYELSMGIEPVVEPLNLYDNEIRETNRSKNRVDDLQVISYS